MTRYYNAYVRNGRLVLDEPATDLPDLPEGAPVELAWAAELRAKLQECSQLRVTTEAARPFDVASTLDHVRQFLAQVAAFAHAKVDLFNQASPTEGGEARRRREILAHLIQATTEAIDDALEAGDQLAAELVTRPACMTPPPADRI